jgi:hypothetical protein
MDVQAVLRLCGAVRQALPSLGTDSGTADTLRSYAGAAEQACQSDPPSAAAVLTAVRQMRYLLIESADGPIAAILADSATRIVGDDIGRLFS